MITTMKTLMLSSYSAIR